MPTHDWTRLHEAILQLYDGAAAGHLMAVVAPLMKSLIPGETVFTAEVERPRQLLRWWVDPLDCPVERLADVPRRHAAEHPLGQVYAATGDGQTRCTTDVIALSRFRDTCVFAEFFRPLGIDRQLGFYLGDADGGFLAVGVGRKGFGFSAEERRLGDVFREHLMRAWRMERDRRTPAHEQPSIEIRLAGPAGMPAREMGRTRRSELDALTAREAEVLRWMAEGKTDAEVGRILGISRDTARKHAENIRAKLLVENRGAAAAVYWQAQAGR